MALVKVEKIVPGMVLSEDVRDMNSRLLLSKGQEMGDQHIRILKMWGVFEVQVAADEAGGSADEPAFDTEQARAVTADMVKLFSNVDMAHPAIKEIMRLAVQYRLQRPGRNGSDAAGAGLETVADRKEAAPKDIPARIDRIEVTLPEVPTLVFELNEILADPMSSAGDIAQVVNKSPSLTATLLKIVNSAFYGFRSKIDSISRAVMLIGSNEVSNLALGITIMETFRDIPKSVLDVFSFLEHNLMCGIVARLLSVHSNMANGEQLFISGMLHDIGRLILCKYFPHTTRTMLAVARQQHQPLGKTEHTATGTTHTQIGKKLLQKWKLPYTLENNVAYHHHPSASPQPEQAAAVQLADIIVHGLGTGSSGEHMVPSFDDHAWEKMKLPVGALSSVINQTVHQMDTFRDLFGKG